MFFAYRVKVFERIYRFVEFGASSAFIRFNISDNVESHRTAHIHKSFAEFDGRIRCANDKGVESERPMFDFDVVDLSNYNAWNVNHKEKQPE